MELENIRAYWNQRAEGYSLSNMTQYSSEAKQHWESVLLSHAPCGEALRCLDVGCGPGLLSILMAENGHKVTSIDYSEAMLAKAYENSISVGVDISIARMDAQNTSFENNSFDYIFCRDLTWNLEQPRKAYEEWLRILAPGGRILVADSNHYLHYHNEDFQEEKNTRQNQDHPSLLGVDPTPIDRIAEDLPLSREFRPAWDVNTFLDLGACKVQAEVERRSYLSPTSGTEKSLIFSFIITAEKAK